MSKPTANMMPALYSHLLHDIQVICKTCGYAIAVHGSMQRDLDLIAVPWTKRAAKPATLVKRLCEGLGVAPDAGSPYEKSHGRIVYTLLMMGHGFVDLSITPREAGHD